MAHAGAVQQLVDAGADALQQAVDGLVEQRPVEQHLQISLDACQVDAVAVLLGQGDLRLFHLHRQPVAGALLGEAQQAVDAGRVDDVVAHVLQRQLGLLRVHRVDGVPGGQVEVVAGGHQRVALHPAAVAEQRHHPVQAQLLVEVGTADVHAAGGEDVVLALIQLATLRCQAHQGEVRGTAADVDDQHQLLALDRALVVEGRGDRLELEGHVLEAEFVRHRQQGVGGLGIGGRIIVDEEHWAAQHHLFEFALGLALGALFQLADEEAEQVAKGQGAAQYGGFAFQQLGAEQAFQCAHQAPFIAFQVFVQGLATINRTALLGVEEDHRRQGDLAVFQFQQRLHARPPPADGGVGGTEVDTQGIGGTGRIHAVLRKKRPRILCESVRACAGNRRLR